MRSLWSGRTGLEGGALRFPVVAGMLRKIPIGRETVGMGASRSDYPATQRYAHLASDVHDEVIESWPRRRDASVGHGQKRGPSLVTEEKACELGRGGRI